MTLRVHRTPPRSARGAALQGGAVRVAAPSQARDPQRLHLTSRAVVIATALLCCAAALPAAAAPRPGQTGGAAVGSGQGTYDLWNGYWHIAGSGATAQVASDPAGTAQYASSPVQALRLGGATPDDTATWERDGASLTVHTQAGGVDSSFRTSPANTDPTAYAALSDPVQPAHSLGQTFTVTGDVMTRVDVPVYTYGALDAVVGRATLRRKGPTGPVVLSAAQLSVRDGDYISLASSGLPRGVYYVELADSSKPVAWPKVPPAYTGGEAYADGAPSALSDRYVRVVQRGAGTAVTMTYSLDGPLLRLDYTVSPPAGSGATDPGVELDSPWVMSGYGLAASDGVGVSRFVGDSGHYLGAAQFKRDTDRVMQDYYQMSGEHQVRIDGTGAADVQLERTPITVSWSMDDHTLTTRVLPRAAQPAAAGTAVTGSLSLRTAAREADAALGEQFPEFVAADSGLASAVTSLYRERALSFTGGTFEDYREWMGLERDWTANGLAKSERAQLLADHLDPTGYVWSWPNQQAWPWVPSPAALLQANTGETPPTDVSGYDSRHFTTNSNFIPGSARWWDWTHDTEFLQLQTPRVRAALNYLLSAAPTGLAGQDGLIVTNEAHDGIRNHEGKPGPASAGSNWWDAVPYGNLDAYANLYFYQALEAAAQLEAAAGNPARAAELRRLRALVRTRYTQTFWNANTGRFAQTIATDGTVYDFGAVYLNMEAIAAGLADASQSAQIWSWLDKSTSSGKADAFSRWIFAPRSNTVRNDNWWAFVFTYYFGINGDFDAQAEDGGAALYVSYYEIMSRLRTRGPDDAYGRFAQIIDRYSKPDHLAGGSPLYYGEIQQHLYPGQVATDTPFPEAGLPAVSFLNGFLGIQAKGDSLHIDPHLPQQPVTVDQGIYRPSVTGEAASPNHTYAALPWAGVRHLSYRGALADITESYAGSLVQRVTADLTQSASAVQWPLTLTVAAFDQAAVATGAEGTFEAATGLWTLRVLGPGHVVLERSASLTPALPEAPVAVLLLLPGLATLAGWACRSRRRRSKV